MGMRKVSGFITVEYSLLIPALMIAYTFLIYIGLYQYNCTVLGAYAGILSVESGKTGAEDNDSQAGVLAGINGRLDYDRCIFLEEISLNYTKRGRKAIVSLQGRMDNPLSVMGIGPKSMQICTTREQVVRSPRTFLRLCKTAAQYINRQENEGR